MISQLQKTAYKNSMAHGFWHYEQAHPAIKIALIHSELSKLLETFRDGSCDRQCDKPDLPLTCAEEECADIFIRLLDFCGGMKINLEKAAMLKMQYNESRPYKHSKAF